MHTFLLLLIGFVFVLAPKGASAQAYVNGFDISSSMIKSGQAVTLTWRISDASGASLVLPCVAGVRYKSSDGNTLSCDQKMSGLNTADGMTIIVLNTSGSAMTVMPALYPKNPDGTEAPLPSKVSLTVDTKPDPVTDFTASATAINSGDKVTFSWVAPDIDKLNMTMTCVDEVIATIEGDDRPRVPCNGLIFVYDVSGSGSKTFILKNTSSGLAVVKFSIFPKILNTGSYDGTHAKSVEITIKPAVLNRAPVITSYYIDPQTLKSGERAVVAWRLAYSPGASFQLKCNNNLTATTSREAATVAKCGDKLFSGITGAEESFTMSLQNPSGVTQEAELLLLPAIDTARFDGVAARSLRLVVFGGGNAPVVSKPQLPTAPLPPAPPEPKLSQTAQKITASNIPFGTESSSEVKLLQEILQKEGVYSGPVTGNFYGLTRSAVAEFQAKYGIPAVGLVGPQTIAKLNEIVTGAGIAVKPAPPPASPAATAAKIISALRRNSRGGEVTLLQKILSSDPLIYPEGTVSGFFGLATEEALKRFQVKYGLEQVGFAGPKTRAKLNEIAEAKGIR